MNNSVAMGMKFYTTGRKKSVPIGGSDVGPRGIGTNIGGGATSSAMRSGVGPDETYFMVRRARAAALEKPMAKAPAYRTLGGVAEQRIPDGNVLDTTYGIRVGGVSNSMEFDPPQTKINSDAVKVWNQQIRSSHTFAMDRMGEWTGRPPIATSTP